MNNNKDQQTEFIYRHTTVKALITIVIVICIGLFLFDLVIHRHVYFQFESWVGFYAIVGFLSYLFIVLSAKGLRKLLRRDEDYYDDD